MFLTINDFKHLVCLCNLKCFCSFQSVLACFVNMVNIYIKPDRGSTTQIMRVVEPKRKFFIVY